MKKSILPALLLAGFVMSPVALAKPGPHGRHHKMKKIMEQLELTDDQKRQIREIREENRDGMRDKRQNARQARKALQESLEAGAANPVVREKFRAWTELKDQKRTARFEQMLKIREVLNPEQRKKFQALRKKHRKAFRKGGGPAGEAEE